MRTLLFRKDEKMDKTKLEQMEKLDAKIEKTNYDLAGLENRKKEMEESKFAKQKEIEKLQEEKKTILAKTDKMNRLQKIIYIAFSSKNDLKQIDLLNAKITEHRNEKDDIQHKIDIQNELYSDTIKEKDKYIEQRKELYIENIKSNQVEESQGKIKGANKLKDFSIIYEIAMKYPKNEIMKKLKNIVEQEINKQFKEDRKLNNNYIQKQDEEEME